MTAPDRDTDRATTEAARWLVALEEDPDDDALRTRFDTWLAADPSNAEAWRDTAEIYGMMAKTPPAYRNRWAPHVGTQRGGAAGAIRRQIAMGAVAALAACLAIAAMPTVLLRLEADHVTATAELRAVGLRDGSTVHLAPDSAIAVEFNDRERRVRLVRGEAFFEVMHDPEHPFRVAAGNVTTTVLGTAFDVRRDDDGAAIAVRRGRVGVDDPTARPVVSERLAAGDWVRVGRDGTVRRGRAPPAEAGSWLAGRIVARDRPLDEVVDELRPYYAGMIVLADGALGKRHVSGVYNTGDPVAALRAMAGAHGGVVRGISPWLLVVSGG